MSNGFVVNLAFEIPTAGYDHLWQIGQNVGCNQGVVDENRLLLGDVFNNLLNKLALASGEGEKCAPLDALSSSFIV